MHKGKETSRQSLIDESEEYANGKPRDICIEMSESTGRLRGGDIVRLGGMSVYFFPLSSYLQPTSSPI